MGKISMEIYNDCDTLMKKLQERINELKEENIRLIKENEKIPHHCKNGDWGICEFMGMSQRS